MGDFLFKLLENDFVLLDLLMTLDFVPHHFCDAGLDLGPFLEPFRVLFGVELLLESRQLLGYFAGRQLLGLVF